MEYITLDELLAAKSSVYFSRHLFGDGRWNFTPEVEIARKRGAKCDGFGPLKARDIEIVNKAMLDLAKFLGFQNSEDYLRALEQEGHNIFNRYMGGNS